MKWIGLRETDLSDISREMIRHGVQLLIDAALAAGFTPIEDQIIIRRMADGNIGIYLVGFSQVDGAVWDETTKGLLM